MTRRPGARDADPLRWLRRQRWIDRSLSIGVPLLLLIAWQVAASTGFVDERFFGSPRSVFEEGVDLIQSGTLQKHFVASFWRVILGYALGATSGVAVGLLLGQSRLLRAAFEPLLSALYVVPKLALLPLLLLTFGVGEVPKILLIAISVFFIVAISSMTAAVMAPKGYIEVARSFSASRWQVFRSAVVPAALPQVLAALRLASGIAVLMLVGAEFVNASEGLGYLIWHSWSLFMAGRMYVGIVTIALFGVAFNFVVKWIGHLIAPWVPRGNLRDEVI